MAPTTQLSASSGTPSVVGVRPLTHRRHGDTAVDRTPPSALAFRPDPAAWLAELDRAPRSCRQAATAVPVRDQRRTRPAGRCGGPARAIVSVGVVVALALAWSIAGWLAGPGSGVDPVGAGSTPDARTIVVVQPGDTLWSIAATIDPDGDVRATVDRLAERNGGSALTVGQRLVVSE